MDRIDGSACTICPADSSSRLPDFEGGIEFQCENGPRIGRVYVTTALITSESLDSRSLCYEARNGICGRAMPSEAIDREIWRREQEANDCTRQTSSTNRP